MSTIEITSDNFESTVDGHDIVIVDAWAAWCGPCKAFAPIFEAASQRHPGVIWGKLDTESHPEIAGELGIRSIPTVLVFREGVLLVHQAGLLPAAVLDDLVEKVQGLDMNEVRRQIEEHRLAHERGECDHDH